jgi:hypothetical protein
MDNDDAYRDRDHRQYTPAGPVFRPYRSDYIIRVVQAHRVLIDSSFDLNLHWLRDNMKIQEWINVLLIIETGLQIYLLLIFYWNPDRRLGSILFKFVVVIY